MSRANFSNRSRISFVVGVVATGFIVLLALGLRAAPHSATSGRLQVVAAENFWGDIAAQIAGPYASVTSIMSDPNADPHLYESGAADAGRVASADIVITNGAGYDEFMTKLLAGSKNPARTVLTAADIMGATGAEVNPHLWYDTAKVPEVAAQIAATLSAQDPAHAAEYSRRLEEFNNSLDPVEQTIAQIKLRRPAAPVAYTEPVAVYLLAAAGLTDRTPAGFPAAVEAGSDPSPADVAAMTSLIANRQIKVLLYNSQAASPVTERLKSAAAAAGVPVVAVTETLPPGLSYQAWQSRQAQAILEALNTP